MPPTDTGPLALAHYLTRLLTALCIERGGELRIPRKLIRALAEETSRQMLVEDTNVTTDELVLRFGTKHSAVYPVEPECPSPKPVLVKPQTSQNTSTPSSPQVRQPLSPEQLKALELVQRAMRVKARMKRPQTAENVDARKDLSEILGPNSTA